MLPFIQQISLMVNGLSAFDLIHTHSRIWSFLEPKWSWYFFFFCEIYDVISSALNLVGYILDLYLYYFRWFPWFIFIGSELDMLSLTFSYLPCRERKVSIHWWIRYMTPLGNKYLLYWELSMWRGVVKKTKFHAKLKRFIWNLNQFLYY